MRIVHRSCAHRRRLLSPAFKHRSFLLLRDREKERERRWKDVATSTRVFLTFCVPPPSLPSTPRGGGQIRRIDFLPQQGDKIGNLSLDRLRYFPSARRPPLPLRGPLQPRVLIGISGFYGTLGLDNAGDLGYRRSPAIFFATEADGFENRHESSGKKKNDGEWIKRKKMLIGG